jgi:hypothetical protein
MMKVPKKQEKKQKKIFDERVVSSTTGARKSNVPMLGAEMQFSAQPSPKRVFWMLRSCPGSSEGVPQNVP